MIVDEAIDRELVCFGIEVRNRAMIAVITLNRNEAGDQLSTLLHSLEIGCAYFATNLSNSGSRFSGSSTLYSSWIMMVDCGMAAMA